MIFMEIFLLPAKQGSQRERTIHQSPRFGTADFDAQSIRRNSRRQNRSRQGLLLFFVSGDARTQWSFAFQQPNVSVRSGGLERRQPHGGGAGYHLRSSGRKYPS